MMNKIPATGVSPDGDSTDADVRGWVIAAQGGDMDAFGALVKMYHTRLYGLACGVLGNADDAQEIAQLTWIRAWQRLATFKRDAAFFSWIYRIAVNLCHDRLRWRSRRREDPIAETVEPAPAPDISSPASLSERPDAAVQRQEARAMFEAALDTLRPEHRLTLAMREIQGLSYEEIAAAMDCRVGTVMSRLFYARKQLASRLESLR